MPLQIIEGREHCSFAQKDSDKIKKHFLNGLSNEGKWKTLGLHWVGEEIRPGNYIGAVWVGRGEDRLVLRVDSKFDNPTMDYMEMFAECCSDSHVGENMQGCFYVWPQEELIEIPDTDDFSFMVVAAFLQELNALCTRHLRRHFHRQRENFTGKVKGKIIISENLRRNIGHAERMFCEYQAISDDILENRILRAALEKAARYLSENKRRAKKYPNMQRWVHACRAHLHGVSVMHIARRDFGKTRHRGAFTPYRQPLHLAKAVLCHFGFNPLAEHEKNNKTPPYAISSETLFERYAEMKLREQYENVIVQGSIRNPNDGFAVTARPDFYVPRQNGEAPLIMDAKYKKLEKKPSREDLYQMVAYSRHCGVLHELNKAHDNKEDDSDIMLHLVYPWIEGMKWENLDFTDAFKSKIELHKIECPAVSDSKE